MTDDRHTLDIARELRAVAKPGGFLAELLTEAADRLEYMHEDLHQADVSVAIREGERDRALAVVKAARACLADAQAAYGDPRIGPWLSGGARALFVALDAYDNAAMSKPPVMLIDGKAHRPHFGEYACPECKSTVWPCPAVRAHRELSPTEQVVGRKLPNLDRSCPLCGAFPGVPCLGVMELPTGSHPERAAGRDLIADIHAVACPSCKAPAGQACVNRPTSHAHIKRRQIAAFGAGLRAGIAEQPTRTTCGYVFIGNVGEFTCDHYAGHEGKHRNYIAEFEWTDEVTR